MKIFSDKECKVEVKGLVLFENQEYYIFFDNDEIKKIRANNKVFAFIELLPHSNTAKLKFINHVGYFIILDKQFDVRSKKFGDISGNEITQNLISEINDLFHQFSFDYKSITTASRQKDFTTINTDLLARFDYMRQMLSSSKQPTFSNCLNLILQHPHHLITTRKSIDFFHKAKNISIKEIFGSQTKFISYNNENISKLSLAKKILSKGKKIFPSEIPVIQNIETYDTQENRFVKYFLQEISLLSLYIKNIYSKDEQIVLDAESIKSLVDSYLSRPFFKNISTLKQIPYSSTTLLKRAGYRELFQHFIDSRHVFKHILDNLNKEYSDTGLHDISYLYEVWCFIKVAKVILDKNVSILSEKYINKNGRLSYSYLWKDNHTAVGFNITYTHAQRKSYSLAFRPDISVITHYGAPEQRLTFFDAKYKVIGEIEEMFVDMYNQEQERTFKTGDIHKMHSYLDAIPSASASFILYPGNRFIFYSKDFNRYETNEIPLSKGVGAIPLSPSSANAIFQNILSKLER